MNSYSGNNREAGIAFSESGETLYNQFYGFSEAPFNLSPDPQFLYLAPSHHEALSSMISGIKERKGFMVITGEVGTGKTTLIRAMLRDMDEKIKTALISHTKIGFDDLLKNILSNLGVPFTEENRLNLTHCINAYLEERLSRDETLVIIIDEAQNLEEEIFEGLDGLTSPESAAAELLQIILVGQPELEYKLGFKRLQRFKQRIAVRRQIRNLTRGEGKEYIEHRLKVVGRNIDEVFTPEAVNWIWEFAEGIPRVINLICDFALLIGYFNSSPTIDLKIAKDASNEFTNLRTPKPLIYQPPVSRLSFLYRILGIPIALALALGAFYYLALDRRPPPPAQESAKVFSSESKPLAEDKPLEEKEVKMTFESKLLAEDKPLEEKEVEMIEVKSGWTLSHLALHYYQAVNPTILDFILEANPQIHDLNLIVPKQMIKVPKITEESLLLHSSGEAYKIHLGTFKNAQEAQSYRDKPIFKEKNLEVFPRRVSSRQTWFKVLMGEFKTKEEALRSIRVLKEENLLPLFSHP